jgi:hypothetical protein
MTSESEMLTITELEARTCRDYSAYLDENSTRRYSDDNIEAWITAAERKIIGFVKRNYTSDSLTSGSLQYKIVKGVVLEYAKLLATNQLIEDGYITNEEKQPERITEEMKADLDALMENEKQIGRIAEVTGVDDW